MAHDNAFVKLVEELKPNVEELDTATLHELMKNNADIIVIDVREESEWAGGHLPNAIHMSKGVIECNIAKKVDSTDADLILYCGGGYRSILAADNLKKMGYTKVRSLAGGWRDWSSKYDIAND